jgi:hypothetical protein
MYGMTSISRMLGRRAPDSRATSMCSRVATLLACERTARAVHGQEVMPMTIASVHLFDSGKEIEMRMSTMIAGIASTTLVAPMSNSSNQPPTNPASSPIATPRAVAISPATRPICREVRVPAMSTASTSYPKLSVPSGSPLPGAS